MINWYLNRLKSFSIAEYPYRVKQLLKKKYEQVLSPKRILVPKDYHIREKILENVAFKEENTKPTIPIFGKEFDFSSPCNINWHKDIFSGYTFPKTFSKKIDIKNNPNLSAKVVWEVNRLQFLMQIALNYQATKDAVYIDRFVNINKSWKNNNPYLVGINWYSNIEVNLRLINWFLCWEALGVEKLMKENVDFKTFVTNDWLPLIYQHCIYSYNNPSKHSSANNHLISEYAGLFIASSKWNFKESDKWIEYSQKGLEVEIIKQHSKNGINKEEAAEYIQFITDFFLLAYIVGENTNRPFSQEYKQQLYQIFDYIYNFLDCAGNFPKYGDEDDGKCFIIDFEESFNNFKSLLTSGAIIFNNSKFKSKSNDHDAKNLFLFGKTGKDTFESIPSITTEEKSKFYIEEGHFILKKNENNKEIYLHFDAAPLGFLSIAAHGHADALSFMLHLDGQPFFIDSGTYTYHTDRVWRNYFMGTLAHNTIRINKLDQATIGGPTLWLKHYITKVIKTETNENYDTVTAQHNGYEKLGIMHTRQIIFDKKKNLLRITDKIECKKNDTYLIELPFHLHPLIQIDYKNINQFLLSDKKGNHVSLQIDSKLTTKLLNGQIEPEIIGWRSESFMHKQPITTILCSFEGKGITILETTISINQNEH